MGVFNTKSEVKKWRASLLLVERSEPVYLNLVEFVGDVLGRRIQQLEDFIRDGKKTK